MRATDMATVRASEKSNGLIESYCSDYTKVDPNSKITFGNRTITLSALDQSDEAYVYYDFGAGFFSGDLTLEYHINYSNITVASSFGGLVGVGDGLGSAATIVTNNANELVPSIDNNAGQYQITLYELDDGNISASAAVNINASTDYWIRLYRDESVGASGTAYLYVYTDQFITSAGNTSITLSNKRDYRYLQACTAYGLIAGKTYTGTVSNVRYFRSIA